MRRSTIVLTASAAFLVVGGGLMMLRSGERQPHHETGVQREEEESLPGPSARGLTEAGSVAALWGEVVSLRHDIEALKAELARRPPASPAERDEKSPSTSQTVPEQTPAGEMERKAEEGRKGKALLAQAEEQFATEPYDATWSSGRSASIQELAGRNQELRGALRSAECRSHTCRIELLDDVAANLSANLPAFLSELAPSLPSVTTDRITGPDGTSSYVLYLAGGT